MKNYFLFYVSMNYVTKNAMQKRIQEWINSIDRSVIELEEFKGWMEWFELNINAICEEFPRCKKETISKWGNAEEKDFHISIAQTRVDFYSFKK